MYSKLWVLCILNSVFCWLGGAEEGHAPTGRAMASAAWETLHPQIHQIKDKLNIIHHKLFWRGLRIQKVDNIWVYENWCIRGIQPALCWDGFRWIQIRWSGIVENTEESVALCVEIRRAPLFLFTATQAPATTQQVATWRWIGGGNPGKLLGRKILKSLF